MQINNEQNIHTCPLILRFVRIYDRLRSQKS